MKGYNLLPILFFLFIGCSQSINSEKELIDYVQANKDLFIKSKKFKQLDITAQCIPFELLKQSSSMDDQSLTFIVKLEGAEKDFLKKFSSSFEEYRQYKWFLMNESKTFIYIEQEGKKIHPDIAQFEERYELGKGCTYNVVFNLSEIDKNLMATLVYNDEIFGMGKQKFRYDFPKILNLPIDFTPNKTS